MREIKECKAIIECAIGELEARFNSLLNRMSKQAIIPDVSINRGIAKLVKARDFDSRTAGSNPATSANKNLPIFSA